jgi:ATP-dependent helicase/nuclease subunit B
MQKKYLDLVVDALATRIQTDPSGAKSLAHVCAVVPTAQSGRRLRLALAARFGALVPPTTITPTELLLDTSDPTLAGRTDEIAAFAEALASKDVPRMTTLEQARQLSDIRAVLAVKALSFADVANAVKVDYPEEAERWSRLAEIEQSYLAALARRGKRDRIEQIKANRAQRTVNSEQRTENSEQRTDAEVGSSSEILRFDEFGNVENSTSIHCSLFAVHSSVHSAATAAAEADRIAQFFAAVKPDEALPALCIADPELFPEIESAFKAHGLKIQNPAQLRLATSSLGHLVQQVADLPRTQSYATFSAFIRGGDVRRWLCSELKLSDEDMTAALVDLDNRQAEFLPEKIDDIAPKTKGTLRGIFEFVKTQIRKRSTRALLGAIFKSRTLDEREPGDREFAAAAEAVSTLLSECGDDRDLLALRLDEATYSLEPDAGEVIVTDGWMELPFLDADEVVIAGFQEGCVPESVVGHPFLPDSLRRYLGLPDNAYKEARDRAILQMTLAARAPNAIRISFHALDAKGDVLKPSRLLFETDDDKELVARVKRFYGERVGMEEGAAADLPNKWKLHLPIPPKFKELKATSPSRINDYLKCPFTYYLKDKTILGDKRMDDRAEELQAWEYGNLAHAALESFAQSELKDSTDAAAIRAFLEERVDAQLGERFGTAVPAIVWMQGESVKGRLANFAEIQSARRAEGWRIVAVERKMELEYSFERPDGTTGRTRLHGRCDRIDYNEKTGVWCVIDYKTWDTADKAASFKQSKKTGELVWQSLQLPIYCAMLDAAGDAEFAAAKRDNITSCFCVLGKTADQVCFTEPMTGGYLPQAEEKICEILVAIERGIFWPPKTVPGQTPEWKFFFEDWLSPSPEETIDADWIDDQESREESLRPE